MSATKSTIYRLEIFNNVQQQHRHSSEDDDFNDNNNRNTNSNNQQPTSSIAMHEGVIVVVGRDSKQSHVVIDHVSVSRKHATLKLLYSNEAEAFIEITDCASKVGTKVDGKELQKNETNSYRFDGKSRNTIKVKFGRIDCQLKRIEANEDTDDDEDCEESATESDTDTDEDLVAVNDNDNNSNEEEGGWKTVIKATDSKKKKKKERGEVNVNQDDVEVETVIDMQILRRDSGHKQMNENDDDDDDEYKNIVDDGGTRKSFAKIKNAKTFVKQRITFNGKLTKVHESSLSPSSKKQQRPLKIPFPYETEGCDTLHQFETARDRELKAEKRAKEVIAEDLFENVIGEEEIDNGKKKRGGAPNVVARKPRKAAAR